MSPCDYISLKVVGRSALYFFVWHSMSDRMFVLLQFCSFELSKNIIYCLTIDCNFRFCCQSLDCNIEGRSSVGGQLPSCHRSTGTADDAKKDLEDANLFPTSSLKEASINCHSEHREESLFAFEVNTEMFRFAQHDIFRNYLKGS